MVTLCTVGVFMLYFQACPPASPWFGAVEVRAALGPHLLLACS